MTRLEELFVAIDKAAEESVGMDRFDPIPLVKSYLAERDDFMTYRIENMDDCFRAKGAGSEFDNTDVEEERSEVNAFDAMFGNVTEKLDRLSIRG